jgi:PAS domain S-box-containing protein
MMKMKMKKLYKNEYEELLALRKRTELLESALNTVQESLVITNSTGQIIMKNQAAQKSEDKPKLLTSTHSLTHGCTLNVSHQKENEVLSYAFNTLPQIIWMTDGLGVNDYVSTRFKEATGRECLSGDNWHAIIHPDDLPELLRRWQNSVQTGRPFEVECRMLFKDYGYQWVMDRGVPVKNADGQIIRWLGTYSSDLI